MGTAIPVKLDAVFVRAISVPITTRKQSPNTSRGKPKAISQHTRKIGCYVDVIGEVAAGRSGVARDTDREEGHSRRAVAAGVRYQRHADRWPQGC